MFDMLSVLKTDSVLGLIKLYNDDPNPAKIDLGVGVYRDAAGATPVMAAVKAAERRLVEVEQTKTYFGSDGDGVFLSRVADLILGDARVRDRVTPCQSVGGTGALRLAAGLVALTTARPRIWISRPTWPNHPSLFTAAGFEVREYDYFDRAAQALRFDAMIEGLSEAAAGDVVLLHGCCHNPTGVDLSLEQWGELASLVERRGLLPLVDFAYQGLGQGLDADAAGLRLMVERAPEMLAAFSCSKNFGLYRERTGALLVLSASSAAVEPVRSNVQVLARTLYSTPPGHGAAVVRTILEDEALRRLWAGELEAARSRLHEVRQRLAAHGRIGPVDLAPLARQSGMFSLLPLSSDQVIRLRQSHSVYMAESGRINVAGLHTGNVERFAEALASL